MPEHPDPRGRRHHVVQQFQALGAELGLERGDSGDVPARPGEALDVAGRDRVGVSDEDDGIDDVADLRAPVKKEPRVTITSGLSRTRSAASSGSRALLPSTHRYSIRIFRPSFQPRSRRTCRKAHH